MKVAAHSPFDRDTIAEAEELMALKTPAVILPGHIEPPALLAPVTQNPRPRTSSAQLPQFRGFGGFIPQRSPRPRKIKSPC